MGPPDWPLDKLVLVYTGTILALDWSLPSSSLATHRVELPEENVILGIEGNSVLVLVLEPKRAL